MSAAIHSLLPLLMRQREERLRAVAREKREIDRAEAEWLWMRRRNEIGTCACGCAESVDVHGLEGVIPAAREALLFVPGHE